MKPTPRESTKLWLTIETSGRKLMSYKDYDKFCELCWKEFDSNKKLYYLLTEGWKTIYFKKFMWENYQSIKPLLKNVWKKCESFVKKSVPHMTESDFIRWLLEERLYLKYMGAASEWIAKNYLSRYGTPVEFCTNGILDQGFGVDLITKGMALYSVKSKYSDSNIFIKQMKQMGTLKIPEWDMIPERNINVYSLFIILVDITKLEIRDVRYDNRETFGNFPKEEDFKVGKRRIEDIE